MRDPVFRKRLLRGSLAMLNPVPIWGEISLYRALSEEPSQIEVGPLYATFALRSVIYCAYFALLEPFYL